MGAFKLGNMTFGSLFKKPETVMYPVERKPQPQGLKGHIVIDANDCILCGMCERSCPTSCLTVNKTEGYWETNRFACIQCGYCITVCPKKCLHMDPNYAPAASVKQADRAIVPKQEKPAKKAEPKSAEREPVVAKPAPAPALQPDGAPMEQRDELLESKIAGMDPEKAARVRAAFSGK